MSQPAASEDPWTTVEVLGAGVVVVSVVALAPYAAAVLHGGGLPEGLGVADAIVGSARVLVEGHAADPAAAFERSAQSAMPSATGWWASVAWLVAVICALAAGVWRRVDAYVSQAAIGRRSYELRGSRTRTWARPRDLTGAIGRSSEPGRFTLGRLDGRLVLSDRDSHVALIAPTRSGKTTRFVIPWLLEHDGPAIVTSTKLDIVEATHEVRAERGKVWVWDPFGSGSALWTPLTGCDDWSYALAQAQWLADASADGDSEIAAYWRGEAAKLLAPLLHAAALDDRSMPDVLAWLDAQETFEAGGILRDAGRVEAKRQLTSISELDDRNRGTTYMSAGSLLAAYRYPELDAGVGMELTADSFFKGEPNTLFVVAGARQQRLLTPLIVGMLSSFLHDVTERARRDGPLEPTLRVLLDEVANIAPLRDLPSHLSQSAASGVRIATVWQSLGQMHHRYRGAADSILANSTTKLLMGPVTDERTRRYVVGLLGRERARTRSRTRRGLGDDSSVTTADTTTDAAAPQMLQQLGRQRALLIDGARKPAIVRPTGDAISADSRRRRQ